MEDSQGKTLYFVIYLFLTASPIETGLGLEDRHLIFMIFPFLIDSPSETSLAVEGSQFKAYYFCNISFSFCFSESD